MDDTQQPEQRQFQVKLLQTVEVTTEVFEFSAANKKEALKLAQNHIDDEKDLEGEYRLVAEEVVPPETEQPETPVEDGDDAPAS